MSSLDKLLQKQFPRGAICQNSVKFHDNLCEKRIRRMAWAIRSQSDWIKKLDDPELVVQWKKKSRLLTDQEIEYVFDEMSHYQKLCGDSNIVLSAVEQVWQSDTLIDAQTLKEFKDHVKLLEDASDRHKDWHPNSNNQVLNLIDPSLYPIIYGRTFILPNPIPSPQAALDIGDFGKCPAKIEDWDVIYPRFTQSDNRDKDFMDFTAELVSGKFCWLPTEFMVSEDGSVTIESYINNLHPVKHRGLYPVIANIFSKFVPLLEQVVTDLVHPIQNRSYCDPVDWFEFEMPEPEEPEEYSDNTQRDEYKRLHEKWWETRKLVEPQPYAFKAPDRPHLPYSFKDSRLQAIVKVSSIQLAPDNPEHEASNWQYEAMTNEWIIATGIYYYDVENITKNRLSFRENVGEFDYLGITDYDAIDMVYGHEHATQTSQEIGYVVAKQGRCLVYPNIYKYKELGFMLADPTKPGHCKMLVFYFIDPSMTIPSTRYVPPQQQEWWAEKIMDFSTGGALTKLPDLVKDSILSYVDFPLSLKEAKKLRLELVEDRISKTTQDIEDYFEQSLLSL